MRRISYLIWPVVTGILAALLILQLWPGLVSPPVNRVEIREAASIDTTALPSSGVVSYADAVDQAAPAVVNIYTRTLVRQPVNPLLNDPFFRNFFNADQLPQRERIESSLGSGVILNPQGYVVTNNHVISGADSIIVALRDGREAVADVVGVDPETDLAVLKVDLEDLPSITFANDDLRIGDVALAIGNPFGVGQTVTMGIISATGRNRLGLSTYEDFIQTDAAINPGNSGGALVDAHGNLIGINTAIFSKSGGSQGIGFAIPSSLARQVMQDLITHGRVIRGWLGVEIQELSPRLAESFGVGDRKGLVVAGIFRNGPAHKAGLQPGDVLLSINGETVRSSRLEMNRIAGLKPGDRITLGVLRNGHEMSLDAQVGERPPSRQ
ncbi:trypsin-like peptidase domain-containing protein [Marinobacterium sp. AK62]|uniref:Trypsin-like peptidase domain-containing protein n=1 Tax=Marinobacterium alkalitolerans TaxID=1542925 RepID=A0ABS3ZAY5_9GAMM|nr:trypsin-like peptidase domain-containing protein [Marinobacterium alkalitolerans]MBP0048781.1 trypsin-like peptidase domain-containing protein [Marinobacterium alkalitolerans]